MLRRLTHLADLDGAIWEEYGVPTQPALAFVDEHGYQHGDGAPSPAA